MPKRRQILRILAGSEEAKRRNKNKLFLDNNLEEIVDIPPVLKEDSKITVQSEDKQSSKSTTAKKSLTRKRRSPKKDLSNDSDNKKITLSETAKKSTTRKRRTAKKKETQASVQKKSTKTRSRSKISNTGDKLSPGKRSSQKSTTQKRKRVANNGKLELGDQIGDTIDWLMECSGSNKEENRTKKTPRKRRSSATTR
jgi:hypothetical protein